MDWPAFGSHTVGGSSMTVSGTEGAASTPGGRRAAVLPQRGSAPGPAGRPTPDVTTAHRPPTGAATRPAARRRRSPRRLVRPRPPPRPRQHLTAPNSPAV